MFRDQILRPELNAFEFEALRQIAAHPASHHVPSRVQFRLKDIGYVKEVRGGLVLTDEAYAALRWTEEPHRRGRVDVGLIDHLGASTYRPFPSKDPCDCGARAAVAHMAGRVRA
jgi:hypothetical protein